MKLIVRPNGSNASFVKWYGSGIPPQLLVSSFIELWYLLWSSIEHIRLYPSHMSVVA